MFARFIAAALVGIAGPALAQSMPMNMPGMNMPAHPKAKSTKPVTKKAIQKKMTKKGHKPAGRAHHAGQPAPESKPMTMPMDHGTMSMPAPTTHSGPMSPMDHSQMQHGTMQMPIPQAAAPGSTATRMDHGNPPMGGMTMPMGEHAVHEMAMNGALGAYPMERESSGTAWQPDASDHQGLMTSSGDWTMMAHGTLNLVCDHQSGRRGDDKAFASGMLMGMAQHALGHGTVQFKAMLSPDPIMGPSGYPLLLASGETANGRDRLIDRQHPHDFFMELSASVSQNIGPKSSVFLYGGLPAEPAFGPPAFMHREAIMDSPEAPITHHWLDSTHISFGVVTAGIVLDRVKLELSRFNGREPDQHRWNIETGPLDSTAARLSWNPTRTLALQGSWGRFKDPEQLEPGVDQTRWSASALWADEIAPGWKAAATLAWGRKSAHGHNDDALAAEASLKRSGWTLFGRAEMTENRELVEAEDGPAYRVGKVSAGTVRDFRIAPHLALGAGALAAVDFVPAALAPLYGGRHRTGAMGFVRVKLD